MPSISVENPIAENRVSGSPADVVIRHARMSVLW
jgi:hypothetical protein